MREISIQRSLRYLVFISSILLQFISGLSDDLPGAKNATESSGQSTSGGSKGSSVAIICLAVVVFAGMGFALFKFWQKRKREEQYARLLKLFEEDDELELELGIRD